VPGGAPVLALLLPGLDGSGRLFASAPHASLACIEAFAERALARRSAATT
jgi:hypothetical protein